MATRWTSPSGACVRAVPILRCAAALSLALAATPLAPLAAALPQPQHAAAKTDESGDWVVAKASVSVRGRAIHYESAAGTIGLRDDKDIVRASMFFTSYSVRQPAGAPPRPVTFLFNGGPGSASLWLHMGSFGPVRVKSPQPGRPSQPPFATAPNPFTLLDKTDLVFLDAIGTGYSRALNPEDNKLYWGNDQDAASFVQGISRYLSITGRWNAPKFLFGESYGTMRAANLAPRLHEKGIDIAGVIMMSTILNFGHFTPGLDQQLVDLLPTYTTTALYHGRIEADPAGLEAQVEKARQFARGAYRSALEKGDLIGEDELKSVAAQMRLLTGLPVDYLEKARLRVGLDEFRRQLLKDQDQSIGSLDTRYKGVETRIAGASASYDPSDAQLAASFVNSFNDYARSQLRYRTDLEYIPNDGRRIMGAWDWAHKPAEGERQNSLANSVPDLAVAMRQMPGLKVLALNGYYDLMTPFFGAEFDLARLGLGTTNKDRVSLRYYPSGHMIYVDDAVMPTLRQDIAAFYDEVLDKAR